MNGFYDYNTPWSAYNVQYTPPEEEQTSQQQMPSIPLGGLMNMFGGGEGGGLMSMFGGGGAEAGTAGSTTAGGGAEGAAAAGGMGAMGIAGIVAAAVAANLAASDYNRKKGYGKVGEHQARDIFHGDVNHPLNDTLRGWMGLGPSDSARFSAALSGDEDWGHKSWYYAPMVAKDFTSPETMLVDLIGQKVFGASEKDMTENFWGWLYGSNVLEKIFG